MGDRGCDTCERYAKEEFIGTDEDEALLTCQQCRESDFGLWVGPE